MMLAESLPSPGYGVLIALLVVIGVSVILGELAQKVVRRGSFVGGYFLGNRSLGVWAMALTATVQSGGTFMGFPSLVYSHGWIVLLWIGSYMVVPITGFAVLGKRIAQLSRRTGAITVPDLLRQRFDSPAVGLMASLIIIVFSIFFLVAQFRAGAIVMKIAWPESGSLALAENVPGLPMDAAYYVGLAVFAATVVGYTLIGGFLASVWTDLFQSVLMVIGVLTLLTLVLPEVGGLDTATRTAVEHTSPQFAFGPGYGREFLPMSLAASMFFIWVFTGVGSPASMVRLMASHDTATLRRSIVVLSLYNMLIYLPIAAIAISARSIFPHLPPGTSDEVIPRLTLRATSELPGGSLVAGLILSAPFGAVMATVSTLVVVIASGLVRDIYQRFINPNATDRQIRRVTYGVTLAVGGIALLANLDPPPYLQALVVMSTSGTGAGLLIPALMACYWRRATAAGALAAMVAGSGTVGALLIAGTVAGDRGVGAAGGFRPYFMLDMEPLFWGLGASLLAGVVVSLRTQPPPSEHVSRLFDVQSSPTP